MFNAIDATTITQCAICGGSDLDLLWDLPKLPFTEKYGAYAPQKCPPCDQQLVICTGCAHVQLKRQISPAILYTPSEYAFRTAQSRSAQTGCQVFFEFFSRVAGARKIHSFLDVGGNDLYLAKLFASVARERTVIDPVCIREDGKSIEGIKVLGRFIEDVSLSREMTMPDLVVCRHVLEHIAQPRMLLTKLFSECSPQALYIFEIPCFENLVEARRFDAIFHQHYHYYDLAVFKRLIIESGGEYIDHFHYRQGSCGGALMIAFKKATVRQVPVAIDYARKREEYLSAIQDYRAIMRVIRNQLDGFRQEIYGYGASLMLATLGYHLQTDFSQLLCILDDDLQKHGMGYQNIPVQIFHPSKLSLQKNANFLITSLENVRPIYKKLAELTPRRILAPVAT